MTMIWMMSLVGAPGIVSPAEQTTFGTLAATGIGALAGAVAGRFGKDGKD